MPLTKIECDRVTCPPGKPYVRLADGQGMYLEVTATGGKYWRMKYRHAGKEKRLALGVFPAVSLAEARRKRDKAKANLAVGGDPGQIKKVAKLTRSLLDATTFEKVARQWWEHWRGPRSPRHSDYVIRRLEADVFPALGPRPISSITAPQLLAMAKRMGDPRTEAGRAWLTERSPLSRANAIKKPLLIGQGANDPRVKQDESDQIVKAMQDKKIPVTYVLFPDEGHGFAVKANRIKAQEAYLSFLQTHLK